MGGTIMAIMGKNIWDNLTTGMYSDSKIIFREYIQNACDAIDDAVSLGLLNENEGEIEIILDDKQRKVSIIDNGIGVKLSEFRSKVGNVADSDKVIGQDKGFRGIGRLCGLAYCDEIIFSSKSKGENSISIMKMDADKLRQLLYEDKEKYSFEEVYEQIVSFETNKTAGAEEHFFKVDLIGIRKSNRDLLNKKEVQEYLSFVAPVPYVSSFIFRSKIYEHAKKINAKIDEYKILVNGEQIYKSYKTYLYKKNKKHDEIFDIMFEDFYDEKNNLIAWLWYGLSSFNGALTEENIAKRLRLRKENIQIGNAETLSSLFNEGRGNSYFIGEVFAMDRDLIPNSQRDNFNENDMRVIFENKLKDFFKNTLYKLYHSASDVRGYYEKIESFSQAKEELAEKEHKGGFSSPLDKEKVEKGIESKQRAAVKAKKSLEKFEVSNPKETAAAMVANRIKVLYDNGKSESLLTDDEQLEIESKRKGGYITQTLPLNRKERKLVTQIYQIITDFLDDEKLAKNLIEKIQEGLK